MSAADVPRETPWGLGALLRRPAVDMAVLGHAVAEVALTVGSLLGLVVSGLTLTAAHNGVHPLVVRSGSMEPTIATGSLVLAKRVEASDINVGDIVTVERPDHTRVTHRVVAIERNGVTALLTLKGDANEDPDPAPVPVRDAYRVVGQVPVIGRALSWLATAPGGYVLGCFSALTSRHVFRLRSFRRKRRGVVVGPVVSGPGAVNPSVEAAEPTGNPPTSSKLFLCWVGTVVEERVAERRSQTAPPIEDWSLSHAA